MVKYIPVAVGMTGGSSDAAAVLFGVNKMFSLGLTTEQLMDRGVKIGADVPYCVMRETTLSERIGEILIDHKCHPVTNVALSPINIRIE